MAGGICTEGSKTCSGELWQEAVQTRRTGEQGKKTALSHLESLWQYFKKDLGQIQATGSEKLLFQILRVRGEAKDGSVLWRPGFCLFPLLAFYFETGFMSPWLAVNNSLHSLTINIWPPCLHLPSARTAGVCHHAQCMQPKVLNVLGKPSDNWAAHIPTQKLHRIHSCQTKNMWSAITEWLDKAQEWQTCSSPAGVGARFCLVALMLLMFTMLLIWT